MPSSLKRIGSGGIRTHASEETGALNQRLRPLGHATHAPDGQRRARGEVLAPVKR